MLYKCTHHFVIALAKQPMDLAATVNLALTLDSEMAGAGSELSVAPLDPILLGVAHVILKIKKMVRH